MSTNTTNNDTYMLSYKNEKGEWVDIPVIYQTAYQAYVAHCVAEDKTPITIEQFYSVFNILANTGFIQQLVETLDGISTLPVNMGGTGATTVEEALQNLGINVGPNAPTTDTPGLIYFCVGQEVQ